MKILVVGATSDIGVEVIKILSKQNKLIISGFKNKNELKKLGKLNNVERFIELDLENADETIEKLKDIEVDALVQLAGTSYIGLMQDMSVEEWDRIIKINLSSAFYISKAIVPNMVKKKCGRMIFASSIWGKVGSSCEVCYSTSKGGLDIFVKSLAKELGPSNISVNSVNFGFVDTKMNSQLSDKDKMQIYSEIPFSRPATPKECAIFINKLLEMPLYCTGCNIGFDGAWY